MSAYTDDRAEAEENALDVAVAALEAHREDYEPSDGAYHFGTDNGNMEPR